MTTMTLNAAVDRVQARAAALCWRRIGLVALMAVPFAVFASVRYVVRALSWAGSWVVAAGMVGWEAAGPRRDRAG